LIKTEKSNKPKLKFPESCSSFPTSSSSLHIEWEATRRVRKWRCRDESSTKVHHPVAWKHNLRSGTILY